MIARSDDVAEDLLSVTDARAQKTTHTTAKKMYTRMRDAAKKNVIEAIPELSKMIEKHLAAAPSQPTATATDRRARLVPRGSRDATRGG